MSREGSFEIVADAPRGGLRLLERLKHHIPTRESIERNRFLRPVAHIILHPPLWRFTRRSVPRGIALGITTGILVPPLHFPASAVLAFPLRANIPAAAGTALIVNPFTAPLFWWLGWRIGHTLFGSNHAVAAEARAAGVPRGWIHSITNVVGPATLGGLVILTIGLALIGYVLSSVGWRWWIVRKWRARSQKRSIPDRV